MPHPPFSSAIKLPSWRVSDTVRSGDLSSLHLDVAETDDRLCALQVSKTGEHFVYAKDWFERGDASQLYAGIGPDNRPRVFKRLSLREPSHAGTQRAQIRDNGRHALTIELAAVESEVELMRAASPALGNDMQVLVTDHSGEPSKVFIIMRAAEADLLEAVTALRHRPQSPAIRDAVTVCVAEQLIPQLRRMHELGIVHRDISTGNILCMHDGDAAPNLCLADFGKATTRDSRSRREDDGQLFACVLMKLLFPELHTRQRLTFQRGLAHCRERRPGWLKFLMTLGRADWDRAWGMLPQLSATQRDAATAFLMALHEQSDNVRSRVAWIEAAPEGAG